MLKIVSKFLDLLYPPRATELLVREATHTELQSLSYTKTQAGVVSLLPYQHPLIKALVKENKFHDNHQAQRLLAGTLNKWVASQKDALIFIPIPLSQRRERERGHNQVCSVLKQYDSIIVWHALKRVRHTTPQTELKRDERLSNLKGAFMYSTQKPIPTATHYVIIDDVSTTGATLRAARAALAQHLPPDSTLTCLALAH